MKTPLTLFLFLSLVALWGIKSIYAPAKATTVGSKICVFVDKNDMEREESILTVAMRAMAMIIML